MSKAYVKELKKVKLSNGETVELRKPSLQLMVETGVILGEVIALVKKEYPDVLANLFNLKDGQIGLKPEYIVTLINELPVLIPTIFPVVVTSAAKLCAVFTHVEKETILEDWQMDDLWAVISPFFGSILETFSQMLTPLVGKE